MASQTSQTVLAKLVKCQNILGYRFRDISLLKQSLTLGDNKRMATAGDTYAQVALVDRWYSLPHLSSRDWSAVRIETLCNSNLANVGFSRGLHLCTLPTECSTEQPMADTVEAVLAAVYRDSLFKDGERKDINWDEFERVVSRLGINHPLIASASDLRWALTPIRTTRKLPLQFFSKGRHLDLAKQLFELSGTLHSPSLTRAAGDVGLRAPFDSSNDVEEEKSTVVSASGSRLSSYEARHGEKKALDSVTTNKKQSWGSALDWLVGGGRRHKGKSRWDRLHDRIWGTSYRGKRRSLPHGSLGFWISTRNMFLGNSQTWADFWATRRLATEQGARHPVQAAADMSSRAQQDRAQAELASMDKRAPEQHTIDINLEGVPDASTAFDTADTNDAEHAQSLRNTKSTQRKEKSSRPRKRSLKKKSSKKSSKKLPKKSAKKAAKKSRLGSKARASQEAA